jgi:hypothetical protein
MQTGGARFQECLVGRSADTDADTDAAADAAAEEKQRFSNDTAWGLLRFRSSII